jgi:glucose-6-phosphate 1-dehydrogenase
MSQTPSSPTLSASTAGKPTSFGSLHTIGNGDSLTIFVIGASGDLARKKTFPALFELFQNGFLPATCRIVGYSRSRKTDQQFREHLSGYLSASQDSVERFLDMVFYQAGQYDSDTDMKAAVASVASFESAGDKGSNHR